VNILVLSRDFRIQRKLKDKRCYKVENEVAARVSIRL